MKLLSALCIIFFITTSHSQELTVEKIWKSKEFTQKTIEGFNSMNDGEHFSKISVIDGKNAITKHTFLNYKGQGEVILKFEDLKDDGKELIIDSYEFNSDETKLLLKTETRYVYRRSFTAVYYLYDLTTKLLQPLDSKHSPQTLAEYSPDGSKVSFIHGNNLYVKDLTTNKVKQLTKDGKQNNIINGSTDWVYEEEFAITKGYDWSPDSKYIAFLKFNESQVKEFTLSFYNNLYPDLYTYKYPKAGEKNSSVTAHILDLEKGRISKIELGKYEYIPRLKWANNENNLIIQTLNRHQNELKYHLINFNKKRIISNVFFEEKSSTYVEIDDNLSILKDGKTIIRTSEIDGYNHIYQINFNGESKQITKGKFDVIEFLGINENTQTIYYSSAEKDAFYKGLYKIHISGNEKVSISSEKGTNDAEFSNGMNYFIKSFSTANSATIYTLCDANGKELQIIEDNKELNDRLKSYNLPSKEFITIKGASQDLNAWIIKPSNFDKSKKYPVYFHVYGGPHFNLVTDSYAGGDYLYHQLLAQKGYIVIGIDPRGTMYRGTEFKKSTYLQLGKLEVEDVIAAAKEVKKLNYVDSTRLGIQGWSFGGYLTSLAITKGADHFKTGIAVAPVTNWKYYDNIYTERYMRTPEENKSGYENNSPINFVSQLKGNYFIIHGSTDDNVHYQNTMEMTNALIKSNKQFSQFIYPNRNHSIRGGNTRFHLYTMLLNYTLENL